MEDQRYCLECGERRVGVSEFLQAGPPSPASPPTPPGSRPPGLTPAAPAPRNNAVTLLAGIGVLLLAMGVGVLIGRSAGSSHSAPPEVVTIGSAGSGSSDAVAEEAAFTSDWPASKKGWTVELQTLPESSTPAAVEAAKTAATGKGASSVGALKAGEFPSVGGEGIVLYAGEYSTKAQATKALGSLRKSFPSAKVVEVSGGSSTGTGGKVGRAAGSGSGKAPPTTTQSFKHPAAEAPSHGHSSGKKFVEESAKLPDVVSTG